MPAFKEKDLAPWQTVEGQERLGKWRSDPQNYGKGFIDETGGAASMVKASGEAVQAGLDVSEALSTWGSRNSSKYLPMLGKGVMAKLLPALSYGLNVMNRESALKQRYAARIHSPRTKTIGEHIENAYNYGLPENFKPPAVRYAANMISPTLGFMLDRSPKAMIESVPAVIPFGDSVFNAGTSMLPAAIGGRRSDQSRESYYEETGRDLGHDVEDAMGDLVHVKRTRPMTDAELWNYVNAEETSKNYEGVGYSF